MCTVKTGYFHNKYRFIVQIPQVKQKENQVVSDNSHKSTVKCTKVNSNTPTEFPKETKVQITHRTVQRTRKSCTFLHRNPVMVT